MSKRTSTTTEQLRALMQTHAEIAAAPAPLSVSTPAIDTPSKSEHAHAPSRYSLRLLPAEIAKINTIIKNSVVLTSERTTLTDVIRVALARLSDSCSISQAEVAALRSTDRRRH
jgi:hypothetical protein